MHHAYRDKTRCEDGEQVIFPENDAEINADDEPDDDLIIQRIKRCMYIPESRYKESPQSCRNDHGKGFNVQFPVEVKITEQPENQL